MRRTQTSDDLVCSSRQPLEPSTPSTAQTAHPEPFSDGPRAGDGPRTPNVTKTSGAILFESHRSLGRKRGPGELLEVPLA